MQSLKKSALALPVLLLTGCSRSPSFDILGSFFPAWLLCLLSALLLSLVLLPTFYVWIARDGDTLPKPELSV